MTGLAAPLGWELRLERRYGIVYAAVAVVGIWGVVLWLLPETGRALLLPPVLILDTAIFGFYLMAGMLFLEKSEGTLASIAVTPSGRARHLALRTLTLTGIALALSLTVAGAFAPGEVRWVPLAAGVVLGSVSTMLASFVLASRFSAINAYILPSVPLLILVELPALHYFELWPSPLLYLLPTMPALVLARGAFTPLPAWELAYAVGYGLVTCLVLWPWARRAFERFVTGATAARPRARATGTASATRPFRRRGWLAALATTELRNLRRDPMQLFLAFYAVFLALVGRWLIPWLVERAAPRFDLEPYVVLMVTFLAVQTGPMIFGSIAGFALLDERDDGSLTALRATPLSLARYALFRTALPTVLSAALCFMSVWVIGLVSAPPLRVAAVAFVAALEAPILALAVATLASNKVEGLALTKALGVFLWPPVLAWFVDAPWQWALGFVPTVWPALGFWQAVEPGGSFWPVVSIGLTYHLALLWLLLRRFRGRI